MIAQSDKEKMTKAERLESIEVISSSPEDDHEPPEWHKEVLKERMRRLDSGEEKVLTLEEAWQQLEDHKREFRSRKP